MDPLGAPSPAFTNQTEYEFEDDDSSSPRDPPPLSSSQQFRREFQAFIHCSQSTAGEDAPAASSQEEPEEDEDEEQHQQQHQQHGSMQRGYGMFSLRAMPDAVGPTINPSHLHLPEQTPPPSPSPQAVSSLSDLSTLRIPGPVSDSDRSSPSAELSARQRFSGAESWSHSAQLRAGQAWSVEGIDSSFLGSTQVKNERATPRSLLLLASSSSSSSSSLPAFPHPLTATGGESGPESCSWSSLLLSSSSSSSSFSFPSQVNDGNHGSYDSAAVCQVEAAYTQQDLHTLLSLRLRHSLEKRKARGADLEETGHHKKARSVFLQGGARLALAEDTGLFMGEPCLNNTYLQPYLQEADTLLAEGDFEDQIF
ncbi:hypothetical protein CF335_g2475 [Tilletia laevis]|nr:hypothetical protein CF335_g2475 [Tilletia laevis]